MFISKHEKIFAIILFILCAVFFLNIGYAQTSDNIDVIAKNNELDIKFENAKVVDSIGVNKSNTYIKTSKDLKNIYLNISDLEYPGAYVEFSVDAINLGKVEAKIESVIANGFENSSVVKFILLNKSDIENKVLKSGEKATINFIIKWDENSNSPVDEILDFNIEVNCVQAI